MSSKDKQAKMQEKFQAVLSTLLREEDNKYCADCEAKGPRWTSWNLGVFICIRCAGIHRNLGVHISKVKSVNLDQWTAEQIASMLAMGNSRAKAIYECNLGENYRRSQSDSAMEQFIRAKYEQRKWIDKNWTPAPITIPPHLIDDEKDKRSKQQGLAEIKLKKESSGNSQTNTTSTTKKSTSSSDRKNELDSNNSGKVSSAAEKKPKQPVIEEPVLLDFDDASAPPPTTKASTTQNNVIGEDLFDNENFKRMNLNEPTVEMPTPVAVTTTTNTAQLNADLGDLTLIGGEDLNSRKALGNNSTGPIDKNSILALYNNINNNNSSSANSNLLNFATSTTNPTTNKPSPNHQYPNTNNNFGGFTANIPTTMTSPNIAAAAAAANQQQLFSPSLFGGANNGITNSHSLFNLSPQINNPPNFGNASSNQPKSGQFNQFNFAPTNNINNLMFPTTTNANKPSGQQHQQPMTNNNAMFNDLNFGPFTTAPTTTSNLNSATSASNTLPNIGNTLVSDLWN